MAKIIRGTETIIMKANQAWKIPKFIQANDKLFGFNFSQKIIDSDIFNGLTGLEFESCNLLNCLIPDGCIALGCNTTQKLFCYWLNPDMELPVEPEDCQHVIDTVEIDDIVVSYHRENRVVL